MSAEYPLDFTARPPKAEDVQATPTAGGKVRVTGFVPAAGAQVAPTGGRLWYDQDPEVVLAGETAGSAAVELLPVGDGWIFDWESEALEAGVAWWFLFRAFAGPEDEEREMPYAPFSEEDLVSALPDDEAPEAPGSPEAAPAVGGEG